MIRFDYETLSNAIANITSSMNDANLEDHFKSVVFNVTPEKEVQLGAYAFTTAIYTQVEAKEVNFEGFFVVDAFKLRDILKASAVANAIVVDHVDLIPNDLGVEVKIQEHGTGEYLEGYKKESSYSLPKVTKPVEKKLNFKILDVELDDVELDRDYFMFVAKTVVPKLDNSGHTKPSNFVFFEPERIYCVTNNMINVIKNNLYSGIETEFSILGRTLDMLTKLLDNTETSIALCMHEGSILFKTNNFVISYNLQSFRSQKSQVDSIVGKAWESAFAVDNVLMDINIKRASLMNDKVKFKVENGEVQIETVNGKYKNIIPVLKSHNLDKCEFIVPLKALETALLKKETYILIYLEDRRLRIADNTRLWYSFISYEDSLKL